MCVVAAFLLLLLFWSCRVNTQRDRVGWIIRCNAWRADMFGLSYDYNSMKYVLYPRERPCPWLRW